MRRNLESPRIPFLTALLLAGSLTATVAQTPAIPWQTSFEEAKVVAAREGKPILLLQMLGRLDEELC